MRLKYVEGKQMALTYFNLSYLTNQPLWTFMYFKQKFIKNKPITMQQTQKWFMPQILLIYK